MNYQTCSEIEVAVSNHFDPRRYVIVPNVSWGMFGYELDLCLLNNKTLYAYEVEIKVSKSDLKKDALKQHHHDRNGNMIRGLYFAMPERMRDCLGLVPERAGVLLVSETGFVTTARDYKPNPARKWTYEDAYKLARLGTLRIWSMRQNLNWMISGAKKEKRDYETAIKNLKDSLHEKMKRNDELFMEVLQLRGQVRKDGNHA